MQISKNSIIGKNVVLENVSVGINVTIKNGAKIGQVQLKVLGVTLIVGWIWMDARNRWQFSPEETANETCDHPRQCGDWCQYLH